jgi:alcohol dehydrogenase
MAVQEQVFGFFIPTVTLMSTGAFKEIGKQIRTLGRKKPYICTDKGIVDSGILEQVVEVIRKDCEVELVVYDKTQPYR